jgi:hypothetical protein
VVRVGVGDVGIVGRYDFADALAELWPLGHATEKPLERRAKRLSRRRDVPAWIDNVGRMIRAIALGANPAPMFT